MFREIQAYLLMVLVLGKLARFILMIGMQVLLLVAEFET